MTMANVMKNTASIMGKMNAKVNIKDIQLTAEQMQRQKMQSEVVTEVDPFDFLPAHRVDWMRIRTSSPDTLGAINMIGRSMISIRKFGFGFLLTGALIFEELVAHVCTDSCRPVVIDYA